MQLFDLIIVSATSLFAVATLLWVVSLALRDSSLIDMFWGPLFVLIAWVAYANSSHRYADEPLLMLLLVTLWGLRLGFHLFIRNAGQREDARYQRWRAAAGNSWWWLSYIRVYLLQAAIALVVAAPIYAVMSDPGETWSALNIAGIVLWLIGFLFELNADLQLDRFRRSGGKGALNQGLWRYSRHPNYFGDAAQWWGLALIALSIGNWWAWIGPLVMTVVFVRLSSGILESGMQQTRTGYEVYQTRTPAFVPWFPKRHS